MWRLLRLLKRRGSGGEGPPDSTAPREAPPVAARRRLSVSYNLSVMEPRRGGGAGGEATPIMLEGHTRDVSATGLALVVPSLILAGRDLTRADQAFLLELELPSGPLRFQVAAARHERLETEGEERYVLGVRITEMSQRDRARLTQFIREARR